VQCVTVDSHQGSSIQVPSFTLDCGFDEIVLDLCMLKLSNSARLTLPRVLRSQSPDFKNLKGQALDFLNMTELLSSSSRFRPWRCLVVIGAAHSIATQARM
jgi:hypothetical protein